MASSTQPEIVVWGKPLPPSEQEAEARLNQEGYESFKWNDVAGETYPLHRHNVDECIWVLKGELTLSVKGTDYVLGAGDRLYLPSGTPHTAHAAKTASVTYLVGQRKK